MTSDYIIKGSILYKTKSKSDIPLVKPIKERMASQSSMNDENLIARTSSSKKIIKIIKPETIKRAQNDGFMAAAIGDLDWLKQTIKITSDLVLDGNGFSTLHLACIHGQLNIIKFLIEEKQFDPNYPSIDGWRPVHLCINKKIGLKASESLRFLIDKGAEVNVKNNDDVYPLHMAASEGQLDCLKILLILKADVTVTDKRGQTPLDLAKLWGHRKCAKLLSSIVWHKNKHDEYEETQQTQKYRAQSFLKDVEREHFSYYNNRLESEEKFKDWLLNQGLSNNTAYKNEIKASVSKTASENCSKRNKQKKDFQQLEILSKSETCSDFKKNDNKSVLTQKLKPLHHSNSWNYSTKAPEKEYLSNLSDFFPRDPYTFLPKNLDLVLLNKKLYGMSLEQIKEFMNKPLIKSQFKNDGFQDKNPVFKPKNIIGVQKKFKIKSETRVDDEASLNLCNDSKAFSFKEVITYINNSNEITKRYKKIKEQFSESNGKCFDNIESLDLIKKEFLFDKKPADDKLEQIKKNFGDDLSKYMKDPIHGTLNQKYEKVFIC